MRVLIGLVLIIVIALGAVVLTVVAVMLLRRGSTRHGAGPLGHAMQELESLFVESKRHVIEEQGEDKREEKAESGEP